MEIVERYFEIKIFVGNLHFWILNLMKVRGGGTKSLKVFGVLRSESLRISAKWRKLKNIYDI